MDAVAQGYSVRKVSNSQRSAVLRQALNSGKRVRITSGQGKAILSGAMNRKANGRRTSR